MATNDDTAPLAATPSAVFIDSRAPDLAALVAGAAPGEQVFVLDPTQDGLTQIADDLAAAGLTDLASIAIVAHGAPGALAIGSTTITDMDLASHAAALATIGAALAPGGSFDLYACDTAQGAAGGAFIADLSRYAGGVDVAGATHAIGETASGENFALDASTGAPVTSARNPFTAATIANYQGTLGTGTGTAGQLYFTDGEATEGTVDRINTPSPTAQTPTQFVTGVQDHLDISFDTVDNLLFSIGAQLSGGAETGYYSLNSYNLSTGALISSVDIADFNANNDAEDDYVGGLQIDPVNHLAYVGIAGNPNNTKDYEILAVSYTSAGVISTPDYDAVNLTQTNTTNTLISRANDATYSGTDDLALDQQTGNLFYTNFAGAYSQGPVNYTAANGVYRISATGRNQIAATLLTNTTQFAAPTGGGPSAPLEIADLTVDDADNKVYFTVYNSGTSTGGIYYVTANGGANQTAMQLAGVSFTGVDPFGKSKDIVFDPTDRQLYVYEGTGADATTGIYQYSLNANGTAITGGLFEQLSTTSGGNTIYHQFEAFALNALPVLTVTGTSSRATQGAGLALAATNPTITDPDSGQFLQKATVTITNGQSGDLLGLSSSFGFGASPSTVVVGGYTFSVTYDSATYTLTIANPSGTENYIAAYESVLANVSFKDGNSSATARTFSWHVTDGAAGDPSGTNTTTTSVSIETPPTIAAGGYPIAVVAGATSTGTSGAVFAGDLNNDTGTTSGLTVTNVTYGGGGPVAAGTAVNGAYGTLTINANGSYSYAANANDPTPVGSHPIDTFTYAVSDGTASSSETFKAMIDRPPVVGGGGNMASYTESGGAATVDSGLTVADPDGDTIAGAYVTIASGYFVGDTLGVTVSAGVTVAYNANGVLTLVGSASASTYQSILESATFSNSGQNPDNYGNDTSRSVTFQVDDSYGYSTIGAGSTSTVSITAVNNPPVLSGTDTKTFTQGTNGATGTAVNVDDALAVTDPDSQSLASATVMITNGVSGDELKIGGTIAGTAAGGISYSYNATSYVLSLSGSATLAAYQSALRGITFDSMSLNPTNYGANTSRIVAFVARDGSSTNNTNAAYDASVTIAPTDQPPVVTASGGTTSFQSTGAGSTPVTVDNGVTVTDADNTTLASATVTITNVKTGDTLGFTNTASALYGNITGSYNVGVLTLTSIGPPRPWRSSRRRSTPSRSTTRMRRPTPRRGRSVSPPTTAR